MRILFRRMFWIVSTLIITTSILSVVVEAAVECGTNHSLCEEKIRKGSICGSNGLCTNPFASGCLNAILGEEQSSQYMALRKRVCNSDDKEEEELHCSISESLLQYPEIRISNGNWESSMFLAWINQILLSELLGVPSTIETSQGSEGGTGSFYDLYNDMTYSRLTYNWEGLQNSLEYENGNCQLAKKKKQQQQLSSSSDDEEEEDDSSSEDGNCCHVIPEIWPGQRSVWEQQQTDEIIVPVKSVDVVGKLGIYVPKFTAQRDLTLTSVLGITDTDNIGNNDENGNRTTNSNRHKLAETFLLPTNWSYYCTYISKNQCNEVEGGDEIAKRPPKEDEEEAAEEGNKFWVEGLYRGYFRNTTTNNCTLNPTTCNGHFIDGRCDWSTLAQAQLYWNDISMTSVEGLDPPYGSYPYWSMVEIWHAANETQSDVMMWWWSTDWMLQRFVGSPGEFVKVDLPVPTLQCIQNRVPEVGRCSSNPIEQVGAEEGSCDYEPAVLRKAISTTVSKYNMATSTSGGTTQRNDDQDDDVYRSALDLLEDFRISDVEVDHLLKQWYTRDMDRFGYDAREAICVWLADNIEQFTSMVPKGYPRRIKQVGTQQDNYHTPAYTVALSLSIITMIATVIAAILTIRYRKRKVIIYAQPDFLYLILIGFALISSGAAIHAITPSKMTCILQPWLILLGSSLELMPLIVKVQAIIKAMRTAAAFRRVKMKRQNLYGVVVLFIVLVMIFLLVWTIIDPPKPIQGLILTDEIHEAGGFYVETEIQCTSSSKIWKICGVIWQLILLFWATILAYQTRKIRYEFNESQYLGFMIYTHFMFVLLRLLLVLLLSQSIPSHYVMVATSYLLSLDTLVTLNIYFVPKFYTAMFVTTQDRNPNDNTTSDSTTNRWMTSNIASLRNSSGWQGRSLTGGGGSSSVLQAQQVRTNSSSRVSGHDMEPRCTTTSTSNPSQPFDSNRSFRLSHTETGDGDGSSTEFLTNSNPSLGRTTTIDEDLHNSDPSLKRITPTTPEEETNDKEESQTPSSFDGNGSSTTHISTIDPSGRIVRLSFNKEEE